MTTKKKYEKPTTKVYVLNQQPQLLAGSNLHDYNWNDEEE